MSRRRADPGRGARGAADPRLTEAIRGLWRAAPELSARGPRPRWLLPATVGLVFALGFGLVLDLWWVIAGLGLLLLPPFAGATLLRFWAAVEVLARPSTHGRRRPVHRTPDSLLPSYTVLVPLYDEGPVLRPLLAGLARLDYPPDRLTILLVLEDRDRATRQALAQLPLEPTMRVVVVPRGGPRTKPKALNYALTFAASELLVVFDAEDRPEPDQLRRAAHAFRRGGLRLACVQAHLNIYNPGQSLITRQFALEYSALFDGLLPALDRLGLPMPLGGTSNHFRLAALRSVGAWDPYNVTEDADLGIRLARAGLGTATIASTTWEEAPASARAWLGQRTRWLKGWVQTWLVHMRHPWRLLRELGVWRWLGLQVVMGGVLLSALAYPIFLALWLMAVPAGTFNTILDDPSASWIWLAALTNLALGTAAPMLVAAFAVVRRGRAWLLPDVLAMPLYWLMISGAGYLAIWDLAHRPFHWEKTRHGVLPPARRPRRQAQRSTLTRQAAARRR